MTERDPRSKLAHDLRSPLNAILTWATLLRSQKDDPSLLQSGLEAIERSARAQAALIDTLEKSERPIGGAHGSSHDNDPVTAATLAAVHRFNEAFGRHDVPAIMSAMTEDCVFDSTRPPPDGERIVGQDALRRFWEAFFERSPNARFDTEEIVAAGDRCVVRWVYRWERDGVPGHVRGVDVFKVRDGKVAEKLSYVKG
jgi:ketosteroid isomerase-like protein